MQKYPDRSMIERKGADSVTMVEEKEVRHLERADSQDDAHHRNNVGDDAENLEGYWRSWGFIGTMFAVILMSNSLFVGYAMPTNILTVINADIGPSPNIYLVSTCFTLVSGVLLLVVGRVSDIVGRRYFFIGGQALAVIGSIICGTANSVNTLIGGTVLIGAAGAGQQLYPLLCQEMVPNKYRFLSQGAVTFANLPTLGFGPLIARALVEKTALGWRWCYWLNVIVAGLSVIFFAACYFPPNFGMINSELTKMQELRELDYGGLFLYSTGLILLMLGFTWAQGTYAWGSAHVIATLVTGAVLVVAFVLYEAYMPLKQPLLPLRLFKVKSFVPIVIVGCVGQMVYYALNVLFPQQITALFTTNNILIGAMSSVVGASLAVGEFAFSPLIKAFGGLRWHLTASSVGTGLFCGLMAIVTRHTLGMAVVFAFISGLCVGWLEMVAITTAGLIVPPNDIGAGSGFFASTRAVTGTIAVSIYVAIYSDKLTAALPREIVPAVEAAGLPADSITALFAATVNGTAAAFEAVPGFNAAVGAALAEGTRAAYTYSFKIVYLSSLAFTGLAVISALFVKDVDHLMTNYVNKTVRRPQRGQQSEEQMVKAEA